MFITTKLVLDIETGKVLECEGYDYHGPIAQCDRAAQSMAKQAGGAALGAANIYGANAAAIGGPLVSQLQSRSTAPPGYGAALPGMAASAGATAAANAGKATNAAQLRAMRTGNAAGQGAVGVGAAQGSTQAETDALQGILNRNAQLQSQQQESALGALGGLYGTNVKAQQGLLGTDVDAANAYTKAGQSGWLQNAMGMANTAANAYGAYKGR